MAETVLVTGGAGFIGSHVVDALLDAGYEVAVVDNLSSGRRENLNPRARLYQADLLDPDLSQVFEKERPSYVNHHAALASVQLSVKEPLKDARVNILGSLNLIENAVKSGVRKFIYASTGGALYGQPRYFPCDEDHPIDPVSPYGVSKHAVEHYLFVYRQIYGLNYTVLRYSNVFGPRQDPFGEAGVIAIFSQRMVAGEECIVNGSGEQERDFVYVGDVVRANLLALTRGDGGLYNIGSGHGTAVNALFAMMKAVAGYPKDAVHGPPKPGEIFKIHLGIAKAKKDLGWEPRTPLAQGLASTVAFFRSAGWSRRYTTQGLDAGTRLG